MVWVIVCGVSPEGREESMVGRTCETGVFKPRLKQRLMDDNSSELTEEDDMTRTGKVSQRHRETGMKLTEKRELIPETR